MIFWVVKMFACVCIVFVTFVSLANTLIVLVLLTANSVVVSVDSFVVSH
jgi:hypothetical protein